MFVFYNSREIFQVEIELGHSGDASSSARGSNVLFHRRDLILQYLLICGCLLVIAHGVHGGLIAAPAAIGWAQPAAAWAKPAATWSGWAQPAATWAKPAATWSGWAQPAATWAKPAAVWAQPAIATNVVKGMDDRRTIIFLDTIRKCTRD